MAVTLESLSDLRAHDVDTIIDVRSPSEFDEDHIPGAVNLPVLDDAERAMLAVGYAGWGPGQLEAEIADNAWLLAGGDDALVFGEDMDGKWTEALARIGISPEQLSAFGGSA